MATSRTNRRELLRMAGATGLFGATASGWLPALAARAAARDTAGKRRHCILLWMSGGPSQTDTFDMKPGHENGGEFKEIATNAPGVRFSEHLPQLAAHADKLAIVRSLSTKEGDHERGSHLMRTGKALGGPVRYPAIGAALAKQLAVEGDALPPYVSVAPYLALSRGAHGPGYLGPKFAPLVVAGGMTTAPAVGNLAGSEEAAAGFAQLRVDAVRPPSGVSKNQMAKRIELWRHLQEGFVSRHPLASPVAHQTIYDNALRMISSDAATAFDLDKEPTKVREKYGRGVFGQGCLLARRLVERGVPFVEVTLNQTQAATGTFGWDTHANNFDAVKSLSAELDAGWASLMTDLAERGLLESTTILWMGEFGRTPQINGAGGRDHFPRAWSCVLGGGGIAGGQAYGKTSADGMTIEENPVEATDVLATLCEALGIDPSTEEYAASGRPFPVIDGTAIGDLLA